MSYVGKLSGTTTRRGNFCVGIGPMPSVLAARGLTTDVKGLEACTRGIVEELEEQIAVFKPQLAFSEALGFRGVAVLKRMLADIREAGAISLLDVKCGDIDSSMAGYVTAYLGDGSPLAADTVILSPYPEVEVLLPTIDLTVTQGRGVYVLACTSNPEGTRVQHHTAQVVIDEITGLNPGRDHAIRLVVGAIHSDPSCDLTGFNASVLAPGIGAQGGTVRGLAETFGPALGHVLPTASREVIGGGRDEPHVRTTRLLEKVSLIKM